MKLNILSGLYQRISEGKPIVSTKVERLERKLERDLTLDEAALIHSEIRLENRGAEEALEKRTSAPIYTVSESFSDSFDYAVKGIGSWLSKGIDKILERHTSGESSETGWFTWISRYVPIGAVSGAAVIAAPTAIPAADYVVQEASKAPLHQNSQLIQILVDAGDQSPAYKYLKQRVNVERAAQYIPICGIGSDGKRFQLDNKFYTVFEGNSHARKIIESANADSTNHNLIVLFLTHTMEKSESDRIQAGRTYKEKQKSVYDALGLLKKLKHGQDIGQIWGDPEKDWKKVNYLLWNANTGKLSYAATSVLTDNQAGYLKDIATKNIHPLLTVLDRFGPVSATYEIDFKGITRQDEAGKKEQMRMIWEPLLWEQFGKQILMPHSDMTIIYNGLGLEDITTELVTSASPIKIKYDQDADTVETFVLQDGSYQKQHQFKLDAQVNALWNSTMRDISSPGAVEALASQRYDPEYVRGEINLFTLNPNGLTSLPSASQDYNEGKTVQESVDSLFGLEYGEETQILFAQYYFNIDLFTQFINATNGNSIENIETCLRYLNDTDTSVRGAKIKDADKTNALELSGIYRKILERERDAIDKEVQKEWEERRYSTARSLEDVPINFAVDYINSHLDPNSNWERYPVAGLLAKRVNFHREQGNDVIIYDSNLVLRGQGVLGGERRDGAYLLLVGTDSQRNRVKIGGQEISDTELAGLNKWNAFDIPNYGIRENIDEVIGNLQENTWLADNYSSYREQGIFIFEGSDNDGHKVYVETHITEGTRDIESATIRYGLEGFLTDADLARQKGQEDVAKVKAQAKETKQVLTSEIDSLGTRLDELTQRLQASAADTTIARAHYDSLLVQIARAHSRIDSLREGEITTSADIRAAGASLDSLKQRVGLLPDPEVWKARVEDYDRLVASADSANAAAAQAVGRYRNESEYWKAQAGRQVHLSLATGYLNQRLAAGIGLASKSANNNGGILDNLGIYVVANPFAYSSHEYRTDPLPNGRRREHNRDESSRALFAYLQKGFTFEEKGSLLIAGGPTYKTGEIINRVETFGSNGALSRSNTDTTLPEKAGLGFGGSIGYGHRFGPQALLDAIQIHAGYAKGGMVIVSFHF